MGTFRITRVVAADPEAVWRVVTDWAGYARWMPLTSISTDPGAVRVGWSFAGRTGVGPVRFSDSMVVTDWQPPVTDGAGGSFRVLKTGRLLSGWALVEVAPLSPGDPRADLAPVVTTPRGFATTGATVSELTWTERISVRPDLVGRLAAPVLDPVNRRLFGAAVDKMAAEAERGGAR